MSTVALIREALLARSAPAALPLPAALQQRLYQAAISIVPPTGATLRAVGTERMESDEALLAAFVRGDAGALETLMQRHLGWMVDYGRKQGLSRPDAEDAAHDAFLALVRKAAELRLDGTLGGYIFGFIRIQVLRARQSLARRRGEPLDDDTGSEIPSDEPSPAMKVLARLDHAKVADAMHRVCTLCEQEVLLFDLEDADDKAIAEALDMTEGNVRVVRHRARAKLRKELATPADRDVPEGGHGR